VRVSERELAARETVAELPKTMQALLKTGPKPGFELRERPLPELGSRDVLVKVKAASLNFRDLMTVKGHYNPKQPLPLIPFSDGAGEVVHVDLPQRARFGVTVEVGDGDLVPVAVVIDHARVFRPPEVAFVKHIVRAEPVQRSAAVGAGDVDHRGRRGDRRRSTPRP